MLWFLVYFWNREINVEKFFYSYCDKGLCKVYFYFFLNMENLQSFFGILVCQDSERM